MTDSTEERYSVVSVTQLEVLGEAGTDSSKHRLVNVRCGRCGSEAVMRKANVKRNKSCGCLKRDTFHAFVEKKRAERTRKPVESYGSKFWAEIQEVAKSPMEACAMAMERGRA